MSSAEPKADSVLDASALVDLLLASSRGQSVAIALGRFRTVHAPAHVDAEVLSALGRLHRAGEMSARDVAARLTDLHVAPIRRHPLVNLLDGAWNRRDHFRLVDALYVELADTLGATLLTTDSRLAAAAGVEPIGA